MDVHIATRKVTDLVTFLEMNDFVTESLSDNILRVQRHDELPVYISKNGDSLYFEVDLGNISAIADEALYFSLLDLNTEVLPVSFGINNSNPQDPRLVLVESREINDLSDQELLAVFDALELATDRAENLLKDKING